MVADTVAVPTALFQLIFSILGPEPGEAEPADEGIIVHWYVVEALEINGTEYTEGKLVGKQIVEGPEIVVDGPRIGTRVLRVIAPDVPGTLRLQVTVYVPPVEG